METKNSKGKIILLVILATIVFSVFLKLDSLFSVANTLASKGWPLLPILLVMVLLRMLFAGLVVLIVLPLVLGSGSWRDWLPEYLRIDSKVLLLGLLSFAVFGTLATVISLSMDIFKGDLSSLFAFPNIEPDPDVVGWGYFLLALIPGIWEELAFRGLIQSKFRTAFSISASIFLSALFFGIFHLSNLVNQAPAQVISGAIMAFFFGLGWGTMTVRSRSVIPAMISHYLIDSVGFIFLNVNDSDPALTTGYFLVLTLLFPIFNIVLTKLVYKNQQGILKARAPSFDNFQEERM